MLYECIWMRIFDTFEQHPFYPKEYWFHSSRTADIRGTTTACSVWCWEQTWRSPPCLGKARWNNTWMYSSYFNTGVSPVSFHIFCADTKGPVNWPKLTRGPKSPSKPLHTTFQLWNFKGWVHLRDLCIMRG